MLKCIKESQQIVKSCLEVYKRHTSASKQLRDDVAAEVNCRLMALKQNLIVLDDAPAKNVVLNAEFVQALLIALPLIEDPSAAVAVLEEVLLCGNEQFIALVSSHKIFKWVYTLLKLCNQDILYTGLQFINTYLHIVGVKQTGVTVQEIEVVLKRIESNNDKNNNKKNDYSMKWFTEDILKQIRINIEEHK